MEKVMKMKTTMILPGDLLYMVKILAATQKRTMSNLIAAVLGQYVEENVRDIAMAGQVIN